MYSAVETALRSTLGESVAENARATAELWAGFSRGRGVEPRRVATRPGDARVPRAPVGQEPDARGAVHQVALLAVERRPGRRRSCSAPPQPPTAPACPQDRRVYPLAAVESNHMLADLAPRAAPPCAGGAHRRRPHRRPHRASTWPPATWSTSTAASRRPSASRPVSSACRSTIPTAARSASAAA